MSEATPIKRGLTLAWSIGLGMLLLAITTVLLLPATKSARIRFDETQQESPEGESTAIDTYRDATDDTEERSTPESP